MAEQDLIRFLDKVSQLQQLVQSVEQDASRRDQLSACEDHNQVVSLARDWGFEIGRRWGESDVSAQSGQNLFRAPCPAEGQESEQVLQCGAGWRLVLIASNLARTPEGQWLDQKENEWVLVVRGSALLRMAEPDRLIDLSSGDHVYLSPHQRHRVERTDPEPGTLWLALYWTSVSS